jgi:TatD DNase family protein
MIDTHCHLDMCEPGSLERAREAGLTRIATIGMNGESWPKAAELAEANDDVYAIVGVHPNEAAGYDDSMIEDVRERALAGKVVAIGETGLDYYRLNGRTIADMEWQRERFRVHIRAGRITRKPLVIHTRSASEDTLSVLREEGAGESTGVFHCFTETMDVARAALDLGFMISFSGILTFKTAADLREVARYVPLDRCLIETDSPYLAPVPFRGKTNTPALVPYVAKQISELKGIEVEEVAQQTSSNFEKLFGVPRLEGKPREKIHPSL